MNDEELFKMNDEELIEIHDEEKMAFIRDYFSKLLAIDYKDKFIREYYHEFISICKNIDELNLTIDKIDYIKELEKYFINLKYKWSKIQIDESIEPEVKYKEETFEKIDNYITLFSQIISEDLSKESLELQEEELIIAKKANEKATWALIIAIIALLLTLYGIIRNILFFGV